MDSLIKEALIKLGTTNPELRQHIRPLLATVSRTAYRDTPYDVEGSDFAVQIEGRGRDVSIYVFHPLVNFGRRGKPVEVTGFRWMWEGSTAWDYMLKDDLKTAPNYQAAIRLIEKTQAEMQASDPEAEARNWKDVKRGVDVEIPVSLHVKNIDGADIYVNLNSNPITISSQSLNDKLEMGHMTYWWRVNPAYKKALIAVAPLLEAAKNEAEARAILGRQGIKYDYHSYMEPGWD